MDLQLVSPVQPSLASPRNIFLLSGGYGGHRYFPTSPHPLVWGIPSSVEASGAWFPLLSFAKITGRFLKAGTVGLGIQWMLCPMRAHRCLSDPCYEPGFVLGPRAPRKAWFLL